MRRLLPGRALVLLFLHACGLLGVSASYDGSCSGGAVASASSCSQVLECKQCSPGNGVAPTRKLLQTSLMSRLPDRMAHTCTCTIHSQSHSCSQCYVIIPFGAPTHDASCTCTASPPSPPSPPPPASGCACDTMVVTMSGGALASQGSRAGDFDHIAGVSAQGKPVFKLRVPPSSTQYLFVSANGYWSLGSDYLSTTLGAYSSTTPTPGCPNDAQGWQYYGNGQWNSVALASVLGVGCPSPPSPPCCTSVSMTFWDANAMVSQGARGGEYTLLPGVTNAAKPVYQAAPGPDGTPGNGYLYFWPGSAAWQLSNDYNASAMGVGMDNATNAACPTLAGATWSYWNGAEFATAGGGITAECTAPPSPPCCLAYDIELSGGAATNQGSRAGRYELVQGATQGGLRPRFVKDPQASATHLYFWPSLADWYVGSAPSSSAAGIRSTGDDSATCPDRSTDWKVRGRGPRTERGRACALAPNPCAQAAPLLHALVVPSPSATPD